jgi:hypothetical protein
MLKLSTSYSKKIPVPGQDYSSQSYHCSVELELSDNLTPDQLKGQIHDTFDMVKRSVEAEINGKSSVAADPKPEQGPSQNHSGAGNGNGNGAKATNKQIKFILDLAKNRGMGLSDVNARVRSEFGAETIYDLDRKQASRLVDTLKAA